MPRPDDAPHEHVYVLANPDCMHCVQAADHLSEWAEELGVAVAGVDLRRHPEAAERWDTEASPSVVVEDEEGHARVHQGMPSHHEFARLLRRRP